MDLKQLLTGIGEGAALEAVAPFWEASMAALPAAGPEFLEERAIREARVYCDLDSDLDGPLCAAAETIRLHAGLRSLAWHCYWRIFLAPERTAFNGWPELKQVLGEQRGLFYLLAGLGMVSLVRKRHAAMGLPEEVTRGTCDQVRSFNRNHRATTGGRDGILTNQLYWLRNHVREDLFRVGRMEYLLRPFYGQIRVYAEKATGRITVLAPPGTRCDTGGYILSDGEPGEAWVCRLEEEGTVITGFPVAPAGYIENRTVTLDTRQWRPVLVNGDMVLDMHIPSGDPLTPEVSIASMRAATTFFERYFADKPARAVVCFSWLWSPVLERFMAPSSNLVRLQHELFLFPTDSDPHSGLFFVFNQVQFDPATAPRTTSLQRGILDFIAAGGRWRGGGMFILLEHLAEFGTQYYRQKARGEELS